MERTSEQHRKTLETEIRLTLNLDGQGHHDINSDIGFFDHMLTLWCVHGLFDLTLQARGDLNVDYHHTVEDVGLVLGLAFCEALHDRKGIQRYGLAVTPMDETLTTVAIDLSGRPYLVYQPPVLPHLSSGFNLDLAHEFLWAFTHKAALNLHIIVHYGTSEHHILESIFKGMGRALRQAVAPDERRRGIYSSKGLL